jgi:hypothetical protein
MPSLLVVNPDDADPVRSVRNPIVIDLGPLACFGLGLAPVLDVLEPPDELHAAMAVHSATARTTHRGNLRRIGEPPLGRPVVVARRCPSGRASETVPKHER